MRRRLIAIIAAWIETSAAAAQNYPVRPTNLIGGAP